MQQAAVFFDDLPRLIDTRDCPETNELDRRIGCYRNIHGYQPNKQRHSVMFKKINRKDISHMHSGLSYAERSLRDQNADASRAGKPLHDRA